MKHKISVTGPDGKTISKEINIRQKGQYDALCKYKSQTFKSKKTYTRKIKHKGRLSDESSFFLFFKDIKNIYYKYEGKEKKIK